MIQRIQTLYLLLVVVLTGLALWLPLADFTVGADTCTLTAFGLKDAAGITLLPTVYLGVVLVAACLLPLVTIFLFKRRLVQIRLCAVELVLLVGAGAMMGIYFYLCNRYFAESEFYSHTLKISLVFPLVCLVFDLLALRAIFRDEKLRLPSWTGAPSPPGPAICSSIGKDKTLVGPWQPMYRRL